MRGLLPLAIILLTAFPARADYADEHPEWFGITGAPPLGSLLQAPPTAPGAYVVRPDDGEVYPALWPRLVGAPVVVLHAGEEDLAKKKALVTAAGGDVETTLFLDLGELNTGQVGEYFPFPVEFESAVRLVDPRYTSVRPYDDAAGSKLGALFETCVYRPPVFMTPGYVQTDGQGTCVVSGSLYGRNPGLTEKELNGQLMSYLGCTRVIRVQALQQDGEGRLDTFFRFAAPQNALVGLYTADQDPANATLMNSAITKLTEELPDDVAITTVAMPAPITLGNSTLRPSYLNYLRLVDTLLVPEFKENENAQNKAVATLQGIFPEHEIILLPATELAYSSSRLTSIVALLPTKSWAGDCTPPEALCDSGDPQECPDLCYSECVKTGNICVSHHDWGKCALGQDGCYDLTVDTCNNGGTCVGSGDCEDPPGECDAIPPGGTCEGDTLKKCIGDTVVTTDCAAEGKFCSVNEEGDAICISACFGNCTIGESYCQDNAVYFCEETRVDGATCGVGQLVQECAAGEVCVEGSCQPPAQPDADADAATEPEVSGTPDAQDWNAGFNPSDDGCSAAAHGRAAPWTLLAVLLLVALWWPRRNEHR